MAHQQLTPEQVKLVLRRAAELERTRADEEAIAPDDLEAIAREVGIAPTAVRRALGELASGALDRPVAPSSPGLLDRALGPADVVVERTLPTPPDTIRATLDRFFRSQLLELQRDFGERTHWVGARGLWSGLQRSLNLQGRYAFLPEAEIETLIVPAEQGGTYVRLVLRMAAERRRKLQLAAVGGGAGAAIIAIGLLAAGGHPAIELVTTLGGAAGGSAAVMKSRSSYKKDLGRATVALERALDQIS